MQLSIPFWSDFNSAFEEFVKLFLALSIPFWSDFNSISVSISLSMFTFFQSHFGLISTEERGALFGSNPRFQSHFGLISTDTLFEDLRRNLADFQSHFGLISTPRCLPCDPSRRLFQSHFGLISTTR
ncbi:predicted coding region AF_0001 [Archaeoglobus fulgidus DSM 4304]|nr:RecName: Full=Uncharacterized protein AF_0001 [Archaeoglobus fulgidus DSM 4304]AAB91240.1 predicted coding region AF_0001 [Archaeoglobus fulgidus DSM 4304]